MNIFGYIIGEIYKGEVEYHSNYINGLAPLDNLGLSNEIEINLTITDEKIISNVNAVAYFEKINDIQKMYEKLALYMLNKGFRYFEPRILGGHVTVFFDKNNYEAKICYENNEKRSMFDPELQFFMVVRDKNLDIKNKF